MSFHRRLVAMLAVSLLATAASADDADVAATLEAMQQRLLQLEDKLEATEHRLDSANQQIEAQQTLIDESGIATGTSSGLSDFIDTIEIGGWVAASYLYNTRDPDGRDQGGFNTGGVPAYPFHPDSNSFSLDQLWFEIERPITEESRAGFRADLVYGKTAGLLSGDFGAGDGLSGNDFEMYQAYIQYLAPIGEGVTFQFGKFATLIGAEVAQANANFNITRGHVYNLFQPITHTGILASTDIGPIAASFGVVNETRSFPAADIDLNSNKAILWSLGWADEDRGLGFSFNGTYGASDSGQGFDTPAGDKETILDFILSYDHPSERFSGYINADWLRSESSVAGTAGDITGYGIAAAGRMAITDRAGFALRAEWVDLENDLRNSDVQIYGITGTVDYALTSKLTIKAELRYDNSNSGDIDELFFRSGSSTLGVPGSGITQNKIDQLVAGVEAVYSF
ncbi:MAG: outer membrane beta-barrel protein [Myxococcota bacterium]|nr:outer membrane beta-barrel protein [Myxococcota bacterium]